MVLFNSQGISRALAFVADFPSSFSDSICFAAASAPFPLAQAEIFLAPTRTRPSTLLALLVSALYRCPCAPVWCSTLCPSVLPNRRKGREGGLGCALVGRGACK